VRPPTPPHPHAWRSALTGFFPDALRAAELLDACLQGAGYRRDIAVQLLGAARGEARDGWELRRLAALLLQDQVLRIPRGDLAEVAFLLGLLGLLPRSGVVADTVRAEGYSAIDLPGFARQLRRRLVREEATLRPLRRGRLSLAALRDLLELSSREHRLALARYLFPAAEVVAEIRQRVQLSSGVRLPREPRSEEEAERTLASLPPYERAIAEELRGAGAIYWIAPFTGSRLGSLVEHPLGTVVLVVKPPGSCCEIELKRAGRPSGPLLGAVFRRDGKPVPASHRLDGGSMVLYLTRDERSTSWLTALWRAVHGGPPPISRTVAISAIATLPAPRGEALLLEHFTLPEAFGDGFDAMRTAMREAVAAFSKKNDRGTGDLTEGPELTARFLDQTRPAQAILVGTSSFRLDRIALYLSAAGLTSYFGEAGSLDDGAARRFADEVLQEILGVYRRPGGRFPGHAPYVAAALAANRARADRVYLSLLRQIGTFWGTLSALRGYSCGESFVARNVGLRSIWEGGSWRVRFVFMDHDGLHPSGGWERGFLVARKAIEGLEADSRYVARDVELLARIYRTCAATTAAGEQVLRRAMRRAYRKTQAAVVRLPEVRVLLPERFAAALRDWDVLVRGFLRARGDGAAAGTWATAARAFLAGRGYDSERITDHLAALEGFAGFLAGQDFLYLPERRAARRRTAAEAAQ
jgi:hypothetical protein